jgi:hypothetical protein
MNHRASRAPARHPVASRSGIPIGKEVRRELLRRVWQGDIRYARKLTASRTVIVLEHGGAEMAFIYSRTARSILSFLEPDAPETVEWRRSRCRSSHPPDQEGGGQ